MRALRAALALAYTASFVAVCLGGCLAAAAPAEHSCCQGENGFGLKASGSGTDCCTITPGVSVQHSPSAPPAFEPLPPARDSILILPVAYAYAEAAVLTATGPPLVLRI